MVYSNRFVMSILLNGMPQHELANGVVPLPFDNEYGLRFRNKHDRRAVVKFTIDGENVSGDGYIVPANSHVDILRHYSKDVRFKFVSLNSGEAVDFGKNGPNTDGSKGVIEAKFYLEKQAAKQWYHPVEQHNHYHNHYHPKPQPHNPYNPWNPYPTWTTGGCKTYGTTTPAGPNYRGITKGGTVRDTHSAVDNSWQNKLLSSNTEPLEQTGGLDCLKGACSAPLSPDLTCSAPAVPTSINFGPTPDIQSHFGAVDSLSSAEPTLKEGVTVEGSTSGQSFRPVWIELEEDYVLLRVVLQGFDRACNPSLSPDLGCHGVVMNEENTHCTQCGAKRSRKSDKFCGQCGYKY